MLENSRRIFIKNNLESRNDFVLYNVRSIDVMILLMADDARCQNINALVSKTTQSYKKRNVTLVQVSIIYSSIALVSACPIQFICK